MDHNIQISRTQATTSCICTATTAFHRDNTQHKGVKHFYSPLLSFETFDPSKPNEMTKGVVRYTRLTNFMEWNLLT